MGALAAQFFAYIQSRTFYRQMLAETVALLGPADGRTLLDIGCGPGELTRLAAKSGFTATGIDADPAIVALATQRARRDPAPTHFAVGRLDETSPWTADVVVAASLLATSASPATTLHSLARLVQPSGSLVILQPNDRMTADNARRIARQLDRADGRILKLWARARQGRPTDRCLLASLPAVHREAHELVRGLVTATILTPA